LLLKELGEEETYYYHPDHLGSVSVVSNHRGEPYERVEYLPFGEMWIEETDPATSYIPFRFTSKEYDEETGLYYYGARYYEPRLSRWMSADPAGWDLINPMEPDGEGGWKPKQSHSVIEATNWYSYVSNNPVKYVDPTGMESSSMLYSLVESPELLLGRAYPNPKLAIQKIGKEVPYPSACMAFATVNAFLMAGHTPKEDIDNLAGFVNERVGQSYSDILMDVFGVEMETKEIPENISMEDIAKLVGDAPALLKFKQSDFWGEKKFEGKHGISYQDGMMADSYIKNRVSTDFSDVRGSKSTADFSKNVGGLYFVPPKKKEEE